MACLLTVLLMTIALASGTSRLSSDHEVSNEQDTETKMDREAGDTPPRIFTTPNYPNNYGNNMKHRWTFHRKNYIPFMMSFFACDCILQGTKPSCYHDSIQFGSAGRRQCSNATGSAFTVSSIQNEVLVLFQSDRSVTYRGCKIGYSLSGEQDARAQCLPPTGNVQKRQDISTINILPVDTVPVESSTLHIVPDWESVSIEI